MTIAAILLAAGESSRMGRAKPLLPWMGVTLVEKQIESLLEGGVEEVYVVTGAGGGEVAAVTDAPHVRRVHNPNYAAGKTTSVKAGVLALADDTEHIVLLAVDQPRPAWVIRRVLESHLSSSAPATSPRFEGHGGHPLVFDARLRGELESITEENEGIREVMRRHAAELNRAEFDSGIVRLDMNTPEAYEAALAEYPQLSRQP